MDDGALLLKAILDNPDEDTPRLVYADWLQENGQEARAEFIRVQCELARILAAGTADPKTGVDFKTGRYTTPRDFDRWKWLDRREREILHWVGFDLWEFVPWAPGDWTMTIQPSKMRFGVGISEGTQDIWHELRRGFTERIECTAKDWIARANEITAAHPVRKVVLTTRPMHERPDPTLRDVYRFQGRQNAYLVPAGEYIPSVLFRREWPKIEFKLPA